ncbi:MAG: LysE family transporter [Pseudomonadota bacterium]
MSLLSGLTPGPGALAIAGTAMSRGHRHGFAIAYGMTGGAAVWAIAAGLGMGAVLVSNQWLFESLKYAGACYLCWLSYRSARSALMPGKELKARDAAAGMIFHSFVRGALVHLTNPKVALYWSSIFVVAVKPGASSDAILGIIIVSLAMNNFIVSTWALVFSRPPIMAAYAKMRRWIEAISAALFGIAAFFVATERR